ncbi:hypothetical protein BDY21DRAFT_75291 [Lineolata rhizophorae]|uniref:Uncharacterized protein n=1 Tax=Lineolata rhizophorae TaxID=578093 RepID=A0A6A6NUJ8_9PEZI|nr:hypothetical protein BDY21DRAFT_75291 [Lineolata rhizophorae]
MLYLSHKPPVLVIRRQICTNSQLASLLSPPRPNCPFSLRLVAVGRTLARLLQYQVSVTAKALSLCLSPPFGSHGRTHTYTDTPHCHERFVRFATLKLCSADSHRTRSRPRLLLLQLTRGANRTLRARPFPSCRRRTARTGRTLHSPRRKPRAADARQG